MFSPVVRIIIFIEFMGSQDPRGGSAGTVLPRFFLLQRIACRVHHSGPAEYAMSLELFASGSAGIASLQQPLSCQVHLGPGVPGNLLDQMQLLRSQIATPCTKPLHLCPCVLGRCLPVRLWSGSVIRWLMCTGTATRQ